MIGFDLDGVIIKIGEILQEEILKLYNYDIYNCRTTYYITIPGISDNEINKIIYDIIIRRGIDAKPYPGAIESLKLLNEKTMLPITFVTARKESLVGNQTKEWLNNYLGDIPYNIIFTSKKSEWLSENKFTCFVDDRFKNANIISEVLPACFLVNRPWNIGREERYNVIRVNSVVDAIEKFINRKNNQKEVSY